MIATIDKIIATLIRHGPIMSANNQIVSVASAIALVAKEPTRTFGSPVTSRHGRWVRAIPDNSRSRRNPEGAKCKFETSRAVPVLGRLGRSGWLTPRQEWLEIP